MFWKCLLCGERISPIRYWRTRSEFCSDEHEKGYREQTLECLLEVPAPQRVATQLLPSRLPPESVVESREGSKIGEAREDRSSKEALKAVLNRNQWKGSAKNRKTKKKTAGKKRRRRPMTAAQREAISERMKAYWAKKKRLQTPSPVLVESRPSRPGNPVQPSPEERILLYTEKAG